MSMIKWTFLFEVGEAPVDRQFSFVDQCVAAFDVALRSICIPDNRQAKRNNPAEGLAESEMSQQEKRHVAGLMRVNHAGEVCAQALYQGQALTTHTLDVQDKMNAAALEEIDHLAWCEDRLKELDSAPSLLNPLWYGGSFMIGLLAGYVGDRWSLGFVAETENQVTEHLKKHQNHLPANDQKTHAILSQMQQDETKHAEVAIHAGAAELPFLVKKGMKFVSKIMTKTSYYF